MSDTMVIVLLLLTGLLVGVLLFFFLRWIILRKVPDRDSLPAVSGGQYLQAFVIVSGLLVLAWFMEAGNRLAAMMLGAIVIASTVWTIYVARKVRRRKDDT